MTEDSDLHGGCLCGRLRYRIQGMPRIVSNCHCGMCRRVSGAPYVTWMTVKRDRVTVSGEPAWFDSSASASRGFCPRCGTHVLARSEHYERYYDIPAGTLDEPQNVRPERHVFANYKVGWLTIDDDLPLYGEDGMSSPLSAGARREGDTS